MRADVNIHSNENIEELKVKTTKSLWRISIVTKREAEDAVAEALGAALHCAVASYFHVKTSVSTISAFCEQRPAAETREKISAGLKRIKECGLKTGPGKITIVKVRREDWAESWKRHFKPIEIKLKKFFTALGNLNREATKLK